MADFALLVYYLELVDKYELEVLLIFSMSDSFNSPTLLSQRCQNLLLVGTSKDPFNSFHICFDLALYFYYIEIVLMTPSGKTFKIVWTVWIKSFFAFKRITVWSKIICILVF